MCRYKQVESKMMFFNVFRLSAFTLSIFLSFIFSQTLKPLSLEEKVGQLLMVHFHGEDVNEDAVALVQKMHVGGIIYYSWANGLNSSQKVSHLSMGLQKLAKQNPNSLPLFIAVDQEGGVLSRLTQDFTIFPGNKALAMAGAEQLAELSAFAMGQELRAVGINMNLAPIVDINSNPRNPVIGLRSFGDSPECVIAFADNALRGFHRAGIITSLKHYPGHGDVEIDTHEDLPILHKTMDQLEKVELTPFAKLANQSDTMMTAHIIVPAFDSLNCATLSPNTLDYLRKKIGFKGAVISDSLIMEGLLKNCTSIDEAAVRAINAGCDILLLGGKQMNGSDQKELTTTDVKRIHASLVDAVRKGIISEERLNQSVARILELKSRCHLWSSSQSDDLPSLVKEHRKLAKEIALRAIRIRKNGIFPSLEECNIALFAPAIVQADLEQSRMLHLGSSVETLYFRDLNPDEEEIKNSHELVEKADILIFCSYNAWKYNQQAELLASLKKYSKPLILISLRDPLDADLFSDAELIITTFSPTLPSIQAAVEVLKMHFRMFEMQENKKI